METKESNIRKVIVYGTAYYYDKEFIIVEQADPFQMCDVFGHPLLDEENPWINHHSFLFSEITEQYFKLEPEAKLVFLYSEPKIIHLPINAYAFVCEEPHTIYVIDNTKEEEEKEPIDLFDEEEDNEIDTGATHI